MALFFNHRSEAPVEEEPITDGAVRQVAALIRDFLNDNPEVDEIMNSNHVPTNDFREWNVMWKALEQVQEEYQDLITSA